MNLIQTLVEASGIDIDDLKKVMMKDARVKMLFQKGLTLEEIPKKPEFLATVKFFLLNNKNVLSFVNDRKDLKELNGHEFKKLRELRIQDFDQNALFALQEFATILFREHSYVERSGMSPTARKEISAWVNSSGRFYDLTRETQKELQTLPNLRPTRPVVLYRGLLFSGSDLKERKRYDGQLELGKGLKFLRSIRDGKRIVDLDWDRSSSWSTSKQTAMQFAKFGPASSSFSATMQWLGRKGEIDGDLGFIISTLAQPEDVLVDVNLIPSTAHRKHGDEGEVILKPGEYMCRVSTKYTKEGEVDPLKTAEVDEGIEAAVEATKSFAKTWMVGTNFDSFLESDWHSTDIFRLLRNKEFAKFKALSSMATKEAVLTEFGRLQQFYHEHLENLDQAKIETLQADRKIGKVVEFIRLIRSRMDETFRHSAFKTAENSRGSVPAAKMTPAQYREAATAYFTKAIDEAASGARYTDSGTGMTIRDLARAFDKDQEDLHRKGKAAQEEVFGKILKGFFKTMNVTEPDTKEESVKALKSALLAAYRNGRLVDHLVTLRKDLADATKEVESDK